ncbi:VOC family protein [Chitinophaga arvensicola]|uniref:Glyoxalase-like domain-containing protein n=1 Tax=Chitinophaga arvensicola TaxID=29529 RepID=A0A1I0S588_9BACT|nr:VOC family protein [Chitinophaga arvensicola]SEW49864.1 Glyoxalase-like domain-containing protein [Chitinophaga arvensicola]
MFGKTKAFSGYSVDDVKKAKQFYQDILGLEVATEGEYMLTLKIAGGNNVLLYGKPNHTPATFTVLNFPVPDAEAAVDQLIAKGITFLQYGGDIQTDKKGIHRGDEGPTVAWFTDPAGNILSVVEAS